MTIDHNPNPRYAIGRKFPQSSALAQSFSLTGEILKRDAQIAKLQELAMIDAMSGAPNRRAWDQALIVEFDHAQREGTPILVCMFDTDHFKRINDLYGHNTGDNAIRMEVRAVQDALRKADLLARYGGDEFGVIAHIVVPPGIPQERRKQYIDDAALKIMNKIRTAVEQSEYPIAEEDKKKQNLPPGHNTDRATISVGGIVYQGEKDISIDRLVAIADHALYRSKSAGRNRVTLGTLDMPTAERHLVEKPAPMAPIALTK